MSLWSQGLRKHYQQHHCKNRVTEFWRTFLYANSAADFLVYFYPFTTCITFPVIEIIVLNVVYGGLTFLNIYLFWDNGAGTAFQVERRRDVGLGLFFFGCLLVISFIYIFCCCVLRFCFFTLFFLHPLDQIVYDAKENAFKLHSCQESLTPNSKVFQASRKVVFFCSCSLLKPRRRYATSFNMFTSVFPLKSSAKQGRAYVSLDLVVDNCR